MRVVHSCSMIYDGSRKPFYLLGGNMRAICFCRHASVRSSRPARCQKSNLFAQ